MNFTINGVQYMARDFDFNAVCTLEESGIDITDKSFKGKTFSFIRAYFKMCSGMDDEEAGFVLNQHVLGGGNFDEISDVISKMLDKSGFFSKMREDKQAIPKGTEDK